MKTGIKQWANADDGRMMNECEEEVQNLQNVLERQQPPLSLPIGSHTDKSASLVCYSNFPENGQQ